MIVDNAKDDVYELDTSSFLKFTEGGTHLLLDADPVAYAGASVCDKATHTLLVKGVPITHVQGGKTALYDMLGMKDKAELDKVLENNPDITYEMTVEATDPASMKHTIKCQVQRAIKETGAGSITLYLTDGASNFRLTEEIATILKYKGNRSPDVKPTMLSEAREYLQEQFGAILCVGLEADDQLAIDHRAAWDAAMEEAYLFYSAEKVELKLIEEKAMELVKTTLSSIDKDLKQCSGKYHNLDDDSGVHEIFPMGQLHLNSKRELKFSGLKGFYAQILKGDDCDNIPNVYYAGSVGTYELLKDCNTEEELFKATLSEIYRGFLREQVSTMGAEIDARLETAIASGVYGNDNKSNRGKVRKKIKDYLLGNIMYPDKHYYHWSEYELKEDGTVSTVLANPVTATVLTITPLEYMCQVARLVYMLKDAPSADGNHLWTPPNPLWVEQVEAEFTRENIMRVSAEWIL